MRPVKQSTPRCIQSNGSQFYFSDKQDNKEKIQEEESAATSTIDKE